METGANYIITLNQAYRGYMSLFAEFIPAVQYSTESEYCTSYSCIQLHEVEMYVSCITYIHISK